MENKRKQEFIAKIQEKVDFLYSITAGIEFGESFKKKFNDRLLDEVRAVMVKRGIIIKNITYPGQSMGRKCSFTWNPTAPAPTKTLYINIANDITKIHREKDERYAEGKANKPEHLKKIEVAPTEVNSEAVNAGGWFREEMHIDSYNEKLRIKSFTDQELWDELKSRGYEIVDGRLAKIVKTYLD